MFRFERSDRSILAEICKGYPVLFDKGYNSSTLKCKQDAWDKIVKEFNSSIPGKTPRDAAQLKGLWKRIKMYAQPNLDAMRLHSKGTGGGPAKQVFVDEAEQMVGDMLGNAKNPLKMQYDDDALPFQEGTGATLAWEMVIPQGVPPSNVLNVASSSSNSNICAETSQRTAGAETFNNVATTSINSTQRNIINETSVRTSSPVMRPHKNRLVSNVNVI